MPLDFGRFLSRLRNCQYDEVSYRWENEVKLHILTVSLKGKQVSRMITEEFARSIRDSLADEVIEREARKLWKQVTKKSGPGA